MIRLQKPKEIGELLQVSESTVLRMAYSGDLPYIPLRSGKRKKIIRFDPVEIEKWLKKRTP
jgi:predicted site-specific integrase-resolvase